MSAYQNSWTRDAHIYADEVYLHWLYSQVGLEDRRYNHYWRVIRLLFRTTFYYSVRNDDNRAKDGINLREHFMDEFCETDRSIFDGEQCNMLEMLVALARRIDGEIMWDPDHGDRTAFWFWSMLQNIGVDMIEFSDENYDENCWIFLQKAVDRVISRTYNRYGKGSLFPVTKPRKDQRKIEIWDQMQAWINEKYPI